METTQHNATHVQHSLVRERTYVIWVKEKERGRAFSSSLKCRFKLQRRTRSSNSPSLLCSCMCWLAALHSRWKGEDHRPPVCGCRPFLFSPLLLQRIKETAAQHSKAAVTRHIHSLWERETVSKIQRVSLPTIDQLHKHTCKHTHTHARTFVRGSRQTKERWASRATHRIRRLK